ncbi:ammonium transporter 3 family protein [Hibiscus syriacus]|uniref:Ammonium transporter 3 family protein n=1 Tax=Hibiscus syriacus TaxID=106335 RepID=A0A6A3AWD9_HIBSY|nr:uncharacterized protein LOC120121119 [Hibiscus syriacus]KAE8708123.1 ammonium transporter 3 family protein [Hibiscus syriacus]
MGENSLGIVVEGNPSESKLSELNIKCWPKWGCSPGRYQLKFDAEETCYLLRGKVRVYPKGTSTTECVEFGAGDLVIIPEGLSCIWDVSVAVDKHYKFDPSSDDDDDQ